MHCRPNSFTQPTNKQIDRQIDTFVHLQLEDVLNLCNTILILCNSLGDQVTNRDMQNRRAPISYIYTCYIWVQGFIPYYYLLKLAEARLVQSSTWVPNSPLQSTQAPHTSTTHLLQHQEVGIELADSLQIVSQLLQLPFPATTQFLWHSMLFQYVVFLSCVVVSNKIGYLADFLQIFYYFSLCDCEFITQECSQHLLVYTYYYQVLCELVTFFFFSFFLLGPAPPPTGRDLFIYRKKVALFCHLRKERKGFTFCENARIVKEID